MLGKVRASWSRGSLGVGSCLSTDAVVLSGASIFADPGSTDGVVFIRVHWLCFVLTYWPYDPRRKLFSSPTARLSKNVGYVVNEGV